jgi:hypothetical protein
MNRLEVSLAELGITDCQVGISRLPLLVVCREHRGYAQLQVLNRQNGEAVRSKKPLFCSKLLGNGGHCFAATGSIPMRRSNTPYPRRATTPGVLCSSTTCRGCMGQQKIGQSTGSWFQSPPHVLRMPVGIQ